MYTFRRLPALQQGGGSGGGSSSATTSNNGGGGGNGVVAADMSRFSEVGSMAPPHGGRKLLKFLILFENSSLLFFPGQFLSGRVLVELEDETPVLGESILNN